MAESEEKLKSLLMKVKVESEKVDLKINIQKTKIMASGSITASDLKCEVKWALGSITTSKASGGDGIPAELFQILKDNAVKPLYSICQHLEIAAVATGLEKVSFIPIPKKGNAKEYSNYHTIALISHTHAQNSPSQASTVHEP